MHLARWLWLLLLSCSVCFLSPHSAVAQDMNDDGDDATFAHAHPEDLGLQIPVGEPIAGGGRRVTVSADDGAIVVAKLHVEIGDRYIVIMPDGKLRSIPTSAAELTEEPYVGYTADGMIERLTADQFPEFNGRKTTHFVFIYNTSPEFQTATSRILESMYRPLLQYFKRQKFEVADPDTPLVVIMFRTREEFDAFRPMPSGVAAYYDMVSNYVILHEQSELTEIAPELAVKQSISTIAHEGVHQILHNIGVQQRLSEWPQWISEGLPEFFAPTDTSRRIRWKGLFQVNDLRLHTLVKHFEKVGVDAGRAQLIDPVIAADELDALGYAKSWALTHFLSKARRDEMFDFLREVSTAEPLAEPMDSEALFKKYFGEDTDQLSTLLTAHLNKMEYVDPWENQTHYLVMVETATDRQTLVTPSPTRIEQWREELSHRYGNAFQINVRAYANKGQARNAGKLWLGR